MLFLNNSVSIVHFHSFENFKMHDIILFDLFCVRVTIFLFALSPATPMDDVQGKHGLYRNHSAQDLTEKSSRPKCV